MKLPEIARSQFKLGNVLKTLHEASLANNLDILAEFFA